MKRVFVVLVAVLSFGGLGCGTDYATGRVCTAMAVPALAVTVVDGSTGQRVCDATVVAEEGSFRSVLETFGGSDMCSYSGPYERPGLYAVRVTRVGYEPAVAQNVLVVADECHVVTQQIRVELAR